MKYASITLAVFLALAFAPVSRADSRAGMPSSVPRYASDLFPGFDSDAKFVPERKEPRWFSWWNGPKKDNAAEQLEWADACRDKGSYGKAVKAYDALVREWPSSPEAPLAQKRLADLLFEKEREYIDAFDEYRYLLDYYSAQCDYAAVAERLFETADAMRSAGKRLLLMRFANTTEVRKAYEAAILRAPGSASAPKAMLATARLFVDENEYVKSAEVCETLRNAYPRSPEAREALLLEADMRMKVLDMHGYNNSRARDTVLFLKASLETPMDQDARKTLSGHLAKAESLAEEEAWKSAVFYDVKTRPASSAAEAYRRFLSEYPVGVHADAARSRLSEIERGLSAK